MPASLAFLIGLAVLLFLAIKLRVSAFVSLLVGALVIGALSGMQPNVIIEKITSGFGETLSSIGIVIIFGVILGKYLEDGGAARRLATDSIRLIGQKRAPFGMAMSGFLISIPVYSDVGYVILAPIAKAISSKGRIAFAVLAVSLSAGLLATHVYVPPTPGPLAAAGLLGIDIGRAIIYGGFAALMMTLAGWLFAVIYLSRSEPKPYEYDSEGDANSELQADEPSSEGEVGSLPSILPLVLPMFLILLKTTSEAVLSKDSSLAPLFEFIGNPNIALAIGAATAGLLLHKRLGKPKLLSIMDSSLKDAGPIIFITAAGGALGAVLKASGAGAAVATQVAATGLPFILIPFLIAGLLKTIQGSGTVAVITAATLCQPLAQKMNVDPILIFLAAGAGARLICHVNDSYFWVYTKMSGYSINQGLRTLSLANIAMALGGLLATFIVQVLFL